MLEPLPRAEHHGPGQPGRQQQQLPGQGDLEGREEGAGGSNSKSILVVLIWMHFRFFSYICDFQTVLEIFLVTPKPANYHQYSRHLSECLRSGCLEKLALGNSQV